MKENHQKVAIELAGIEDAEAILALQRLAYRSEAELYDDYSIQPLTQTMDELFAEFQTHSVFKAMMGTVLVGSVRTEVVGDTCYVKKLIVDPSAQNNGVGKALMKHVEAHHDAVKRFELFTGYRSEKNLHLYGKLGYREFKRERSNEKLVFVFMEKRIRRDPGSNAYVRPQAF